jgi:serpin B
MLPWIPRAALCAAFLPPLAAQAGDPLAADRPSAAGNHAFAADLHRSLVRAAPDQDLAFSPLSIRIALAMVRAGAEGETRAEIDRVLRFSGDDAALGAGWRAFESGLRARQLHPGDGAPPRFEYGRADAGWVDRRLGLRSAYVERLRSTFGAEFAAVDFADAPEAARARINAWVAERTAQRIPALLEPGDVDAGTALVLTDALRAAGAWQTPLQVLPTRTFHGLAGDRTDVPFVGGRMRLPFHAGEGATAVALPVEGGALAMVLVLPREGTTLAGFEAGLDGDALGEIVGGLAAPGAAASVDLALPRFEQRSPVVLNGALQALGLRRMFTSAAELGGIAEEPLAVSLVRHEAFVRVDEHGMEAAAATAVGVKRGSAPGGEPQVFHADRPFLFALVDRASRLAIFVGRIVR